ncbi:MAG: 50S ribosomal protein L9 [Anaerolineaceae bacterium]|nr:50S ribosomal protein L9 [Anaerolineaceae bacterium]
MKVLLIKDVYKLGHAGDVKKIADGYGRNYLMPKGLAVIATQSALKQAERIRGEANKHRDLLNTEMSELGAKLAAITLTFAGKAGETGKLYGSITHQMIADALQTKIGVSIDRRQVEVEPIRTLGTHIARVRLTVDIVPEVKVIVHREGEVPAVPQEQMREMAEPAALADETLDRAE